MLGIGWAPWSSSSRLDEPYALRRMRPLEPSLFLKDADQVPSPPERMKSMAPGCGSEITGGEGLQSTQAMLDRVGYAVREPEVLQHLPHTAKGLLGS